MQAWCACRELSVGVVHVLCDRPHRRRVRGSPRVARRRFFSLLGMVIALRVCNNGCMLCTADMLRGSHVFVGIRRHGEWTVKPAAQLNEGDLTNVDLLRDFQSTRTLSDDLAAAHERLTMQAEANVNPFDALLASERQQADLTYAIDLVCKAVSKMMRR